MSARILVVDDSGLARRVMRQLLEELGHSVEEAVNGEDALERYVLTVTMWCCLIWSCMECTG